MKVWYHSCQLCQPDCCQSNSCPRYEPLNVSKCLEMSPNLSRNDITIVTNSAVEIEPGAQNVSRDGITKFSSDQTLGEMISPTPRTRCLEMSRNCPKFQTSYQTANGPTRRLRALLSAAQTSRSGVLVGRNDCRSTVYST